MEEYPNNSYKHRQREHNVEKVVTGEVITPKDSVAKKLFNTFISEDVGDIKSYVINALVQTTKNIIMDSVKTLLFGNNNQQSYGGSYSYTSYNQYYNQPPTQMAQTSVSHGGFDYRSVGFKFRPDAELALAEMNRTLARYTNVTVRDLYNAAGMTISDPMASDFGWVDLRDAMVIPYQNVFVIRLPKPIHLD